ncbi:hypothetical protein MKZ38_005790 [Zalerion maritima]|uniref:Major facilitator superfamily (MFS) profile domain-containing protein n=1 Tax=Zalerion maritima TaxID=339359 RepID=A0AAD5RVW5_9PEZI|nr:hypothetical protein MKZ38_005790 [Zalerion maritima]
MWGRHVDETILQTTSAIEETGLITVYRPKSNGVQTNRDEGADAHKVKYESPPAPQKNGQVVERPPSSETGKTNPPNSENQCHETGGSRRAAGFIDADGMESSRPGAGSSAPPGIELQPIRVRNGKAVRSNPTPGPNIKASEGSSEQSGVVHPPSKVAGNDAVEPGSSSFQAPATTQEEDRQVDADEQVDEPRAWIRVETVRRGVIRSLLGRRLKTIDVIDLSSDAETTASVQGFMGLVRSAVMPTLFPERDNPLLTGTVAHLPDSSMEGTADQTLQEMVLIRGLASKKEIKKFHAEMSKPENQSLYPGRTLCYVVGRIGKTSGTSELFYTAPTPSDTLCGTLLRTENPGETQQWVSTIGGLVEIDGSLFIMTTSHTPDLAETRSGKVSRLLKRKRARWNGYDPSDCTQTMDGIGTTFTGDDWKVVEIPLGLQLPNSVQSPQAHHSKKGKDPERPRAYLQDVSQGPSKRRVWIVGAGGTCLFPGTLEAGPTFMASKAQDIQTVWVMDLFEQLELPRGISGSWVVDPARGVVVGSVIAASPGFAYIMPLRHQLEDIRSVAEATISRLPSPFTTLLNLAQHWSSEGDKAKASGFLDEALAQESSADGAFQRALHQSFLEQNEDSYQTIRRLLLRHGSNLENLLVTPESTLVAHRGEVSPEEVAASDRLRSGLGGRDQFIKLLSNLPGISPDDPQESGNEREDMNLPPESGPAQTMSPTAPYGPNHNTLGTQLARRHHLIASPVHIPRAESFSPRGAARNRYQSDVPLDDELDPSTLSPIGFQANGYTGGIIHPNGLPPGSGTVLKLEDIKLRGMSWTQIQAHAHRFVRECAQFLDPGEVSRALYVESRHDLYHEVATHPSSIEDGYHPVQLDETEARGLRNEAGHNWKVFQREKYAAWAFPLLSGILYGFVLGSFAGMNIFLEVWGITKESDQYDRDVALLNSVPYVMATISSLLVDPIFRLAGRIASICLGASLIAAGQTLSFFYFFQYGWPMVGFRAVSGAGLGLIATNGPLLAAEMGGRKASKVAMIWWQLWKPSPYWGTWAKAEEKTAKKKKANWFYHSVALGVLASMGITTLGASSPQTGAAALQLSPLGFLASLFAVISVSQESPLSLVSRFFLIGAASRDEVERAFRQFKITRTTNLQAIRDLYLHFTALSWKGHSLAPYETSKTKRIYGYVSDRLSGSYGDYRDFIQRRTPRNALVTSIAVAMSSQICGINATTVYSGLVFLDIVRDEDEEEAKRLAPLFSLGTGMIIFLFAFPVAVGSWGWGWANRSWLLGSFPLMAAALLAMAIAFLFRGDENDAIIKLVMVAVPLWASIAINSSGVAPRSNMIASEVFPLANRPTGFSLTVASNMLIGALLIFSYPFMYPYSFSVFPGLCVVSTAMTFLLVDSDPDGKGPGQDERAEMTRGEFVHFQLRQNLPYLARRHILRQ